MCCDRSISQNTSLTCFQALPFHTSHLCISIAAAWHSAQLQGRQYDAAVANSRVKVDHSKQICELKSTANCTPAVDATVCLNISFLVRDHVFAKAVSKYEARRCGHVANACEFLDVTVRSEKGLNITISVSKIDLDGAVGLEVADIQQLC